MRRHSEMTLYPVPRSQGVFIAGRAGYGENLYGAFLRANTAHDWIRRRHHRPVH